MDRVFFLWMSQKKKQLEIRKIKTEKKTSTDESE